MTDYRHFFVVDDATGQRVGAYDVDGQQARDNLAERLPDGYSIEPIRIPGHAAGREQTIEQLTAAAVNWDANALELPDD